MINFKALEKCITFTPDFNIHGVSCSIVGSSSTLLNSGYGKIIDDADVVVRFNQAITHGYENDVGSKMTVRFINGHSFCAVDKNWPSRKMMQERHAKFDPDFLLKVAGETIVCKDHSGVKSNVPDVVKMVELSSLNGWI